jgi:disulfide bond formation protein DsbB
MATIAPKIEKDRYLNINIFFAWVVALVATLGSLFFSEVMYFVPCTLCWYQRLCMYPLAIILLVGLLTHDRNVLKYSFIFVLLGLFFSIYHNLIHYEIIPESASPCVMGVPCSTKYIEWFGFITIPMLSLIAFIFITLFLTNFKKDTK